MKKIVLLSILVLLLFASCEVESAEGNTPVISTYTVRFVTDSDTVIEDETIEEGKSVYSPSAPEKEGYVFDGWYVDSGFSKKFSFPSKVTEDITLYAKWIEIVPGTVRWAGVRVSTYGMRDAFGRNNFPDVEKMSGFADKMESCYEGSTGAYLRSLWGPWAGTDVS